MALEVVGGAVLGAVVGELLKAVIDTKQKASSFQPSLTRLESTLKSIIPRIDQISRLNQQLNHPEMEELVALINNGKALVIKCSKISTINLVKKLQYSKELHDLDNSLLRYFMTILPLDHFKDTKEILMVVKELQMLQMKLVGGCSQIESAAGTPQNGSNRAIVEHEDELGDDCLSSSMVVPLCTSISPNGKFRHSIIRSWQKGDILGSGSYGTVYEGYSDNGLFFAVTEVLLLDQGKQGQQSIYQLEQDISLLSQLEHENIVQYLGKDKDEARLYTYFEFMAKGTLTSLYQKFTLSDSHVSACTRQILNGLKYLHERNVVHRNINSNNILVDASGSLKLAGFGSAKANELNDIRFCKKNAFWMAPEVVNQKKIGYGLAADICTVLEMLTSQIPYSHLQVNQALFRISRGDPPPIPNSLPRDARDFIYKCLQVDPDNRPTASQLLEHSFVKRSLQANSSPAYHCFAAQHRSGSTL